MKTLNTILLSSTFAATLAFAASAGAQSSEFASPDGITASPRTRQMLNERHAVRSTPVVVVKTAPVVVTASRDITASPRVRQQLDERRVAPVAASSELNTAGYQPTGSDGITASPRVRQQLNDRTVSQVLVAPLK